MHTPLSDLFIDDARRFGERLAAFAPRLGHPAPEPVTGRIGRGVLVYAEHALSIIRGMRENFLDRIAERTCPWWLRPIPSSTVVAFEPTVAVQIPAHAPLTSRPLDGVACGFRTLRALHVGPYRVARAHVDATPGEPSLLHVAFESRGPLCEALTCGDGASPTDDVSLFIGGDRETALALVHAMTTAATGITWHSMQWAAPIELPAEALTRPGFDADEALAPDPDGLPYPFGIVSEALVAPDTFRFVRIGGLGALRDRPHTDEATVTIILPSWVPGGPIDVRAHCVPVVNIFESTTEPVPLDFTRRPERLRVTGLHAEHGGIYAVRDVFATDRSTWTAVRLPDRRRHTANVVDPSAPATFATTRETTDGALRIHFAPRGERPMLRGESVVSARVLATNRAHAAKLRAGDITGSVKTPGGPALPAGADLRYLSVVPASPFVERPAGGSFKARVLTEAAVRASSPLRSLRRALALTFPTWALSNDQADAFASQLAGLGTLTVGLARRETKARAIQTGYRYELSVDESSFVGRGQRGLFGAALAEALGRCLPLTTFLELVVTGAKTGEATTYRRGMLA